MLSIEAIERMLVNGIVVGARVSEPLDALLGHLLARRSGDSGRVSDGVTLGHELVSSRHLLASGVALMIDQTVEPLHVELTLDSGGMRLVSGVVCFGDSSRIVRLGSREHESLRDRLLVEPDAEFAWKERFRRTDDRWLPGDAFE